MKIRENVYDCIQDLTGKGIETLVIKSKPEVTLCVFENGKLIPLSKKESTEDTLVL